MWDWILVHDLPECVFSIAIVLLFYSFDFVERVIVSRAIHPPSECKGNSLLSAASIFKTIKTEMSRIDTQLDPHDWNIVIEKYLQMFGAATFRTQSLFYLAEINGIIQYKCWEDFNILPQTFHPSTARY